MDADYCLNRADECDLLAEEARDPKLIRELRTMADDWRAAAGRAANDNPRWSAKELSP